MAATDHTRLRTARAGACKKSTDNCRGAKDGARAVDRVRDARAVGDSAADGSAPDVDATYALRTPLSLPNGVLKHVTYPFLQACERGWRTGKE